MTATAAIENDDSVQRESTCQIVAGSLPIHQGPVLHVPPIQGDRLPTTLQAAFEIAEPRTVKLQCALTGSIGGDARGSDIAAIRVAAIDGP